MGRRGGIHPDDDVAANILAEQQRDAMPSPEEARREAEKHMRSEGCWVENCDVDDPDQLRPYTTRVGHDCPALQHPPMPDPDFACPAHRFSKDSRRMHELGRWLHETENAEAVVLYECNTTERVKRDPHPDAVMAKHGQTIIPDVGVRHSGGQGRRGCEQPVKAILYANGATVGDVPGADARPEVEG